ncbi:hypothetical protein AAG906_006877 [Vitis piasezkii]
MYGKCKCVEDAVEIFEMMRGNDIFSWNSIVSIHEECGDHDGTLRLLDRMMVLMHGREIHGYMIVSGLGKDGKYIDDNPLVYVMSLGIQKCFLKLEVIIKLTFKTFPYCQFSLNL